MIQQFQKFAEVSFINISFYINIYYIGSINSYLTLIAVFRCYGLSWLASARPQPAIISLALFMHPSQRWINRGACGRASISRIQMRSIWVSRIRSLSPIKNVQCRASVI